MTRPERSCDRCGPGDGTPRRPVGAHGRARDRLRRCPLGDGHPCHRHAPRPCLRARAGHRGRPGAREDLLFAALANGTRREVLRLLRERGPQPVQALADHFAMRRPSLSEHLRVLREAGLVSEERAGRQRIYRLEAAPLADVQDWLHPYERFWRDRLKGLGDLLDRMSDDAGT